MEVAQKGLFTANHFDVVDKFVEIVTNVHMRIIIILLFLFFSHTKQTNTHTVLALDLLNCALIAKLCEFLSCHSAPHSCGTSMC